MGTERERHARIVSGRHGIGRRAGSALDGLRTRFPYDTEADIDRVVASMHAWRELHGARAGRSAAAGCEVSLAAANHVSILRFRCPP
jgi:hypothetical protein